MGTMTAAALPDLRHHSHSTFEVIPFLWMEFNLLPGEAGQ